MKNVEIEEKLMSSNHTTENNKIKYGEIHFYYPFKITSEISYKEICQIISNTTIIYNQKYQEQKLAELEVFASSMAEDLNKLPENPYKFKVPIIYNENANLLLSSSSIFFVDINSSHFIHGSCSPTVSMTSISIARSPSSNGFVCITLFRTGIISLKYF